MAPGSIAFCLGLSHTGFPSKIRSDTHLRAPSVSPPTPGADRGSHVLPSRPSLSSPLLFLIQRERWLFRAHFYHHPPPTPSFQVSRLPQCPARPRGLPLRNSHPHSRLKSLTPGACAYSLPSLGMPFLGFESNSFLVFPDSSGQHTVQRLGAHSTPLSPQVISGSVGSAMHPGGPGSAWNRAQVAREARRDPSYIRTSLARFWIPRTETGRRYPQPSSRPTPRTGPAPTRARGTRCGLEGSTPGAPRERAAARAATAAAAALGLPGTAPARPPGTLRPP